MSPRLQDHLRSGPSIATTGPGETLSRGPISGVGGFEGSGGIQASSSSVAASPTPPCTKKSHRIFTLCMDPPSRPATLLGPIIPTPPQFCMSWDRDTRRREGGNVGRGVPSPSDWGPWERRKLPSGVRSGAPSPTENGFYAYFRSERSHLEHHFQTSRGPGKTPPSRRACLYVLHYNTVFGVFSLKTRLPSL